MPKLLTQEDQSALIGLLHSRYGGRLRSESFRVESGRAEPGFVEMTLYLESGDEQFRYEMDFRVELAANQVSEEEAREILVGFAGWYLDEYFSNGRDLLLPLDFQPHRYGDNVVLARGDITNPKLDRMADEILAAGVRLGDPTS